MAARGSGQVCGCRVHGLYKPQHGHRFNGQQKLLSRRRVPGQLACATVVRPE